MNKSKSIFYNLLLLGLLLSSCAKDESSEALLNVNSLENSTEKEFVTLKSGFVVEKRGSDFILEGDIILTPEQLSSLDEKGNIFGEVPENPSPDLKIHPVSNLPMELYEGEGEVQSRALGIYPTEYNLWAMVRFVYNSNLTAHQRSCIRAALQNIEAATNVRFYNATGQPTRDPVYKIDYPYLDFTATGNVSYSQSYVGRIGGRQQVSLADFAFTFGPWLTDVIEHEIGHALGMLHEQSRPDRDSYVNINWNNLKPMGSSNFNKQTTNYYYVGTYDFTSIMGYSSMTISTDAVYNTSVPMYTRKDGTHITAGTQFSNNDRMWVNSLYIPYIARSDTYRELAATVYKSNNTVMTAQERLQLQAQLNNGNPNPPSTGRISNNF